LRVKGEPFVQGLRVLACDSMHLLQVKLASLALFPNSAISRVSWPVIGRGEAILLNEHEFRE